MNNEVVEKTEIKVENGISKERFFGRELFKGVIGQNAIKKRLFFYLQNYYDTKIINNILFTAPKGTGKNTIIRELAKALIEFGSDGNPILLQNGLPKRKTYLEINCSTLTTVKNFVNDYLQPYICGENITVCFDEIHKLNKELTCALLTILNPTKTNKNIFQYGDFTGEIDFTKQTFLFATSERVDMALENRLTRVTLDFYKPSELAAIIQLNCEGVEFDIGVLEDAASVVRNSARTCFLLAKDIMAYLRGSKFLSMSQWIALKNILGIYKFGINSNELKVLRCLAERPFGVGHSLNALSAKLGLNKEVLQRDLELQLQICNFLEIQPIKGRLITHKGISFLKEVDEMEKVA